jgi:hypothetical protein
LLQWVILHNTILLKEPLGFFKWKQTNCLILKCMKKDSMPSKIFSMYEKLKRKTRGKLTDAINNTALQFKLYPSYWHYRLSKNKAAGADITGKKNYHLAQQPNYDAGIGHQLANWNAGYYFSKFYKLRFAHFPFSNKKWEYLLGFGEHEADGIAMLKDSSIKKIRLPRFNSEKQEDLALIRNIIHSYNGDKILFLLELDQGYREQCGTHTDLSEKFFSGQARKENKLFYKEDNFNIALHIRRGDIVSMKQNNSSNWEERWLHNDYYANVLKNVLSAIPSSEKAAVYLFSQGTEKDFPEFTQFSNIHYCLDVNAYDSFLHMVYADVLISSKSSFSYKPALLSKGIKICPGDFWHAYPLSPDFILADNIGNFDSQKLATALNIIKQ